MKEGTFGASAQSDSTSFLLRARGPRSSHRHGSPYVPIIPIQSLERLKSRRMAIDDAGLRPEMRQGSVVRFLWRRSGSIDLRQTTAERIAYAGEDFRTGRAQA